MAAEACFQITIEIARW